MPNWCNNTLIIKGQPKQLHKLLKHIELTESEAKALGYEGGTKFSCHRVKPRPADQEDNWYEWNKENWGSKWDLTDLDFFEDDWESGMVGMNFQTAWTPIQKIMDELATEFPKVRLEYTFYEEGANYWGKTVYHKGTVLSEDVGDLSSASCDVRLEIEGDAHHSCDGCGGSLHCQDEATPTLCEDCYLEQDETDKELWDTSIEEEKESANAYATVI